MRAVRAKNIQADYRERRCAAVREGGTLVRAKAPRGVRIGNDQGQTRGGCHHPESLPRPVRETQLRVQGTLQQRGKGLSDSGETVRSKAENRDYRRPSRAQALDTRGGQLGHIAREVHPAVLGPGEVGQLRLKGDRSVGTRACCVRLPLRPDDPRDELARGRDEIRGYGEGRDRLQPAPRACESQRIRNKGNPHAAPQHRHQGARRLH